MSEHESYEAGVTREKRMVDINEAIKKRFVRIEASFEYL